MIGRLRGELAATQPPRLLLDVGGVGYELEAPLSVFFDLPGVGASLTLYTHLVVREDAHALYGFRHERERGLFRDLLKVSGVGAKMALAILSGMSADEFAQTVHAGDSAALTRLPGIGKKTAERLIIEMRDRLESASVTLPKGVAAQRVLDPSAEATEALVALGYKPAEAARMVRAAAADGADTATIIRSALKAQAAK